MRRSFATTWFALFAVSFCVAPAAAEWPSLWPKDKEETPSQPTDASEDTPLLESPFFKIGWPKVEMPKIDWTPGFGADEPAAAGGENPVSRALDRVASSSRQAADKVRSAWGSAVDSLTPGGARSRQTAEQPGMWSRLFGSQEPTRPRTTTEFIAQERVGTTR